MQLVTSPMVEIVKSLEQLVVVDTRFVGRAATGEGRSPTSSDQMMRGRVAWPDIVWYSIVEALLSWPGPLV